MTDEDEGDAIPPPLPRNTPEVRQGRLAWIEGKKIDENPYEQGHRRRTGWFVGWLDRQTEERLGHILFRN
jgi:ribosome modulation factor